MMEVKCTCQFCLSSQYSVDIASFSQKRRCGVSGILRVKNDAEFLADSIESCIEALDELIIVYNDCTDQSPEIIKIKAKQYCNKIKYYEYKPKIYSNNLSEEEYKFIKSQKLSRIVDLLLRLSCHFCRILSVSSGLQSRRFIFRK